jgi:hypothetical protein
MRYEDFSGEMRAYASELNNAFAEPLSFSDVRTIAKSVAKWAWSESTFEKFSEIQSIRAQIRRVRNEAKLATVPGWQTMSNVQVAEIIGRTERTARRYKATPRAAYEASSITKAAPWEAMSISRATYYRRKANAEI